MTRHARLKRDGEKNMDGTYKSASGNKERRGCQIILFEIALEMKKAGLPKPFIVDAVRAALDFEGIADLMKLWKEEENQKEKNEIVADIQDMLNACLQTEKAEAFYVKFNDLDAIAKNIRLFKDSLLAEIDKNGGIKHLVVLTGIPQPSLSRFFNSNSMPQRSTLIKIAKALDLDEIKMECLWNKEKVERKSSPAYSTQRTSILRSGRRGISKVKPSVKGRKSTKRSGPGKKKTH